MPEPLIAAKFGNTGRRQTPVNSPQAGKAVRPPFKNRAR